MFWRGEQGGVLSLYLFSSDMNQNMKLAMALYLLFTACFWWKTQQGNELWLWQICKKICIRLLNFEHGISELAWDMSSSSLWMGIQSTFPFFVMSPWDTCFSLIWNGNYLRVLSANIIICLWLSWLISINSYMFQFMYSFFNLEKPCSMNDHRS